MSTDNLNLTKKKAEIKEDLLNHISTQDLLKFIIRTMPEYSEQWFHRLTCGYLDKLLSGEIKKLMIFLPPQTGKSEISSRRFPAYALGKDPDLKIAVCSYSPDLASGFNRSVQDIMDSQAYSDIFPNTRLLSVDIDPEIRGSTMRNASLLEIIQAKGFYKTVGILSSLTGNPVDIGIIDDPFKDRKTANSQRQRDDVWDWYTDVFKTRLHNDSKQLLLFTRWHEDDLAGRILDPTNKHWDEEEASEWTVIAIPALKEGEENPYNTVHLEDPRELDESIWEGKHSAKYYLNRKRTAPTSFASLDQQRPALIEGNKMRREWFVTIKEAELPFNPEHETTNYYIDGAFTESTEADESGLLACVFFRGKLYIYNCMGVRKELYEFLEFFPAYVHQNYYSPMSKINIELKASGHPMMSMLNKPEYGNFNAVGIPNKTVALGKWNRVENTEPFLASGKIILVEGGWNKAFITQCTAFPNGAHDDMVDCFTYAVYEHFVYGIRSYGGHNDFSDFDIG